MEALIGACFPDPHALRVNTRDQLESFDGDATFFTDHGFYTVSSKRRILRLAMHLSWLDAEDKGVNFYIKKFGSSSFIVEFGDSSAETFLPGCQFDLRQYQGRPSVQEILKSARKRLTDVCSSYEESLSILNNRCVTSEELQQDPAETPLSKALNSEMTEALDLDDANQQTLRAISDEVESSEVKKPGFEIIELVGNEVHQNELLIRFLNLYGFCMQGCIYENPRAIFTINNIDNSHLDTLYSDLNYRGPHLCALSMEPHSAMVTQDGKLSQWTGSSSGISIEGIFHFSRGGDGTYHLEGEDYFLPWDSFFGMLNGALIIRDRAPDLWLGTQNRYFIRGSYRDFSKEVIQWNYFQESIMSELIALFGEVKRVLGKTP